ncbi:MAG: hypothetical protein JOZ60_08160 [Verrucomicrobia bacterium]|nr:hypothetical protein [Verrucomicrobiota bacterium]
MSNARTRVASPGRRHILLTGEGSLAMTFQEISTVMRHNFKPRIFVNQVDELCGACQ